MFPGTTYAEWITKPGLPYADTIFPGIWKFYFYALSSVVEKPGGGGRRGSYVAPHIRIEVSRRDSTGRYESDTTLIWYATSKDLYYAYNFATKSSVPCTLLKDDTLTNELSIDTVWIKVPVGFPMKRTDRLYIKVFLDTRSYGWTGWEQYSYIYYNSTESPNAPSWLELPPAP